MSAIDEQAAAYVAARAAGRWDEADQVALEAWLAADTRHQGAFFRAEAAWAMLDRASVMGAGFAADSVQTSPFQALAPRPRTVTRRQWLAGGGLIAASIASTSLILPALNRQRLRTEVGELRKVPLKDQSIASVNTDSALDVALGTKRRDIRLIRGEAWFQVAKDKARPFVVEADTVRARAVGTAFGVRRYPDGAEVMVSEGVVEVWNTQAPDTPIRLEAGGRVFMPYAAQPSRAEYAPETVDRRLAWREGQIALDNDSLAHAAAEFNRYNSRKIVIADPELGDEKLVGWFRADQPDTFARSVHLALDVTVRIDDTRIVIGGE
ncbi:FecR family protein [Asticcacaulis excentricus]|uniref:Anti-FecI sigma factor, FecR n=1 Tax=Asticcacaulis excentricus (strain ATCC 15261 / DSM 4724 / KCTC 12464 / NCIMB 9791 / VKM B-1370 / CB 48) TaxID=573065 RepID=E8RPE9_ASTEC|nr:FecR domain-containing protein [Asticcacaulis excentricus]ADU13047.1 anti-FecI sigma factor, FecR [Asticcacaulis excentricus CB 48]